jgi:hypothetical protein
MRTCKVCGTTSNASEFYRGVNNFCKECHKSNVRENRKKNADRYKEYDAKRFREDPKVKARHAAYRKTPAGIASMSKARRKWREANSDKRAAHVILGNAVRDGRIIKPEFCSECGAGGTIHGHHGDYSRPLDVVWLCQTCHKKQH